MYLKPESKKTFLRIIVKTLLAEKKKLATWKSLQQKHSTGYINLVQSEGIEVPFLTKCLTSHWLLGINVSVPSANVCPEK